MKSKGIHDFRQDKTEIFLFIFVVKHSSTIWKICYSTLNDWIISKYTWWNVDVFSTSYSSWKQPISWAIPKIPQNYTSRHECWFGAATTHPRLEKSIVLTWYLHIQKRYNREWSFRRKSVIKEVCKWSNNGANISLAIFIYSTAYTKADAYTHFCYCCRLSCGSVSCDNT